MSYNPNNPNGQNTMANSAPVTVASDQTSLPISASSLPLPTGAATSVLQTQPGVDIGDVTINNASGASAVNIQDGGNSITVDVGAPIPTGSNTIGALTDNQSVNLNQLAGNTISSGVGATGTGTVRVVQANDAGKTILSKGGSAASSGNNTLIASGTNKLKIKAFSLTTTSTTSVTCIFQSGASGTELWRVVLQAPTGVSVGANLVVPAPDYIFSTASSVLLNLNLSSAQTVHYSVSYIDEA